MTKILTHKSRYNDRTSSGMTGVNSLSLYRPFCIMKIKLSQGYSAIVDKASYFLFAHLHWYAKRNRSNVYAYAKNNGKNLLLHRVVLNVSESSILVDHKDGNGLNNKKSNLRIASRSQNGANRKAAIDKSSIYLGVYYNRSTNKWMSSTRKNGVRYTCGSFENPEMAAIAYNKKAIEVHGDFAKLNLL